MAATIKIEKLENDNIIFTGLTGKRNRKQLNPNTASIEYIGGEKQEFAVYDSGNIALTFPFSQVAFTQIMPAAAVPIGATTAAQFFDLMRESFFFNSVATPTVAGDLPLLAEVQTTINTPVEIYRLFLPNNSVNHFRAIFCGLKAGSTEGATLELIFSVRVNSAGVYTKLIPETLTLRDDFVVNPAATVTVTGNVLKFNVNSGGAQIINWKFYLIKTT